MKIRQLERDVKKSLKKKINSTKGLFKLIPYNPYYGEAGIPDFIGVMSCRITRNMVGKQVGLFFGIEAKAPGKKPTALQIQKMKEIKELGGVTICGDNAEQIFQELISKLINYKGA